MSDETYGDMLARWRATPLRDLMGEGANAAAILRTINPPNAPLTPARKAALICVADNARLRDLLRRIDAELVASIGLTRETQAALAAALAQTEAPDV